MIKHLSILVPDTQASFNTFACIVGVYDVFKRANEFWKDHGRLQLFKVELAGVSEKTAINNGLLTIKSEVNISAIRNGPHCYSCNQSRL